MKSRIVVQLFLSTNLILLLISVVPVVNAVSVWEETDRVKQQSQRGLRSSAATTAQQYIRPLDQCVERFYSIDSNDDGIVTEKEYIRFIQELTTYEQSTICTFDDESTTTKSSSIRKNGSSVIIKELVETFNTVACFCNEIPLSSANTSETYGSRLRHNTRNTNKASSRDDHRRQNNGNHPKCCSSPLEIPYSRHPVDYVHNICNYVIEKFAENCWNSKFLNSNNSPKRTTIKKIMLNLMNSKASESSSETAEDIFATRNAQEKDSYSNLNDPKSSSSNTQMHSDGTNNHSSNNDVAITDDAVNAGESTDYEQKNMKLILVLILLCCCLFVVVLFYIWIQRQRKQTLIQQTNDGLMLSSDHIKFESYNNSFTERSGDTIDCSYSEDNVGIQEIKILPDTLNHQKGGSSSHHSKSSKGQSPLGTKYFYSPRNKNNNYNIIYYSDGDFLHPNQTSNSSNNAKSLTKISSSIYNTIAGSSGHTKAKKKVQEITINPSVQYDPTILEDQIEFSERNTKISSRPSYSSVIADIQALDCRQDSFYYRYQKNKPNHNCTHQQYVSNPQEDDGSSTASPFVVFADGDVVSSHGSIESSIYSPIHRMNSSHTARQSPSRHPNRHVKQLSAPRDALDEDVHLRKLKDLETPSSSLHRTKVYRREQDSTRNSLNDSSSHTNSSATPDSEDELAWNEFERQCSNNAEDESSVGLSLADFDHMMLIAKSNHTSISEKRRQKLLSQSYKIEVQSNKARAGKSRRSLSRTLSASKLVAQSLSQSDRSHRDLSKSPKSKSNHRTRTHSESPIKRRNSQKQGKHRRSHSSDTGKSENWESVHLSQC